jgi:PAS domain S-box-containing protein
VDYFNQRWFEYTALSVDQAAGSWLGIVHPDDSERCHHEWTRSLLSGEMFQAEVRLRRGGDGAFRWHLCRAIPERNLTGQIVSWLGTFTDIEDQKRAQAILAEFKATLDAEPDAVIIFDPSDWRIIYTNHGASLLLGHSGPELSRISPLELVAEPDRAAFREVVGSLLEGSEPHLLLETRFRRQDPHAPPLDVAVQLIRIGAARMVAIARDITERKRAFLERELLYREAVDAIRARDEFLSVASHELRTPLSALQLSVQVLLGASAQGPDVLSPALLKAKLELAARQIERLTKLIAELLDVSRITAGRLRLELEDTDLSAVVRDVAGRLGDEAARAHSQLVVSTAAPVAGRWDRMRVEQVITNLLSNAFKFGGGEPVEITVEDGPGVGRLVVVDHGIGIAAEDVERIFDRYEQATSSRVFGGLGLGLYIARQIVEAHGGTIRAESQPGAGSTFIVELPKEPPPAPAELAAAPPDEAAAH